MNPHVGATFCVGWCLFISAVFIYLCIFSFLMVASVEYQLKVSDSVKWMHVWCDKRYQTTEVNAASFTLSSLWCVFVCVCVCFGWFECFSLVKVILWVSDYRHGSRMISVSLPWGFLITGPWPCGDDEFGCVFGPLLIGVTALYIPWSGMRLPCEGCYVGFRLHDISLIIAWLWHRRARVVQL